MPRIDSRFGTISIVAFALTLTSGLAATFQVDAQTRLEQINGPAATNLSGVTVNASTVSAPTIELLPADLTFVVNYPMSLRKAKYVTRNQSPSAVANQNQNPCDSDGDPILPESGTKVETVPVFALPGEMGLKYVLYYNTASRGEDSFGSNPGYNGWTSNISYWLDVDCSTQNGNATVCPDTVAFLPDGATLTFSGGPTSQVYRETFANGQAISNSVASLTRDSVSGNYTLQDEGAETEVFDKNGKLLSITDASGIGWTFSYINGTPSYTRVTHTNGQSFTLGGGAITDPAGNVYTITGINSNSGFTLSYPGTPTTTIAFKSTDFSTTTPPYGFTALTEVDYNGAPYSYTSYVTAANSAYYKWATGTSLADGSKTFSIAYAPDSTGYLTATITNPLGHVTIKTYGSASGQLSSISNDAVADCGATDASRSYDANGNLSKTVDNNGNVHTYTYAANGQLQTETEAYGTTQARTTDYVWDSNLKLNRLLSVLVEGWSKTIYTYNSQNRLASVAVTNLSGNGTPNQTLTTSYGYTLYPNGMVQTMTVTHPSPNNSDVDTSQYDTLGNLTSMTDDLGHTTTYGNYNALGEVGTVTGPNGDVTSYTYDARGRVATKTTHPNGIAATWSYGYDNFGLLASINAPDGEVTTWNRDAEMRVTTMTHNDKDGTSTEAYGYDANNDVISKTVSRNGTGIYSTSTTYDALGRPYQVHGNHGQQLTYSYDGNGNVLSTTDATGHVTSYQYDALNRVIQKTESGGGSPPLPSGVPTLNAPASSTNGSYTLSWGSIGGATSYELQEQVNGGGWVAIQNNTSLGWSTSGKTDGTYGYRVHACNATGCGPWSNVATVTVLYPPGAPGLNVPASNNTGSYTVSWSAVATAASYDLQEQVNGGGWTTVQSNASVSWGATSKPNGTYGYQVQACNASGCSAWSPVGSATVLLPPPGAPSLSAPATNATGSYTVSWSGVTTATSYNLQEQINGGSWATVQSTSSTSWGAAGKSNGTYAYRVQACNGGGCSTWSTTNTTTVLFPPGSPPSVSSPGTNSTGSYTVSWSTIPAATSYNLQEQVNGGAWSIVQSGSATTWNAVGKGNGSYGYQAQSCNSGGCSVWSSVATTTVLHPPGSAPTLSVPGSSATGSYTVNWSAVSTATSYTLQEQVNGGGWTTLQSGASTSWSTSGRGDATYGYQVQACNSSGCGPWSSIGSSTVLLPPGAPSLSVPGNSGNGSYTVSWSGVATATSYNLQEQANGGGWSTVQSGAATSWGTSGRGNATYGYHVQACNSSGCGPWSGVGNVTVLLPPGSAPALSVAGRNYASSYTVNWSGVATASSYTLQEQVNGGGWTTVQANGSTSWSASGHSNATYGYQVQACNMNGCGPWSGVGSTIVVIPTPIAMNGQTYSGTRAGRTGSGNEGMGFSIVNGNTWEVYKTQVGVPIVVLASGALPPGASTVQYTWIDAGLLAGVPDAGGSISNPAGSPVAVSSNPMTQYTTNTFSLASGEHGHQYSLRVDFYDAAGVNVSSSTCLLVAEVLSTN